MGEGTSFVLSEPRIGRRIAAEALDSAMAVGVPLAEPASWPPAGNTRRTLGAGTFLRTVTPRGPFPVASARGFYAFG